LKSEIDISTVASGVLHGVFVSQTRQLPDEPGSLHSGSSALQD
jgi:hypothetical protein